MRFRRRRPPEAAVDLTPLIDVVFLLLIFFMVTTTFIREGGVILELPEAATEPTVDPKQPVEVVVGRDGDYAVGGRPLADRDIQTLMTALGEASGDDNSLPLVISADGSAPHQAVVTVMDAAGRMGFERVRIATRQPEGGAP